MTRPNTTSRAHGEAGFTLIELMIASGLAAFILLPAMYLFVRTLHVLDQAEERLAMNAQARQIMRILADGGIDGAAKPGLDGTHEIYGLRASKIAPLVQTAGHTLSLTSNGLTLSGDMIAPVTIDCTGAGVPIPGCLKLGAKLTLSGWLAGDLQLDNSARSVSGQTTEISFSIIHPAELAVPPTGAPIAREYYRGLYFRQRDEPNP